MCALLFILFSAQWWPIPVSGGSQSVGIVLHVCGLLVNFNIEASIHLHSWTVLLEIQEDGSFKTEAYWKPWLQTVIYILLSERT